MPFVVPLEAVFVGESGPASDLKDETNEMTFAANDTGKSSIFWI